MSKFSHLKAKKIATAEFTLHNVNGAPRLVVRSATDSDNPKLAEAKMKRMSKMQARLKRGNIDKATVDEVRDIDRDLFPTHVITGWVGVMAGPGVPAPFSETDLRDFLKECVDNDDFDEIRQFCGSSTNFRETSEIETLAGNSPTG